MATNERRNWRRTARGRLRFELAGIAFARAHGMQPEDWSAFLWSHGAPAWMDAPAPGAAAYLEHEAEAFAALYPEVGFEREEWTDERAVLRFTRGCLTGWGRDRWAMAQRLGLTPEDAGRYCAAAFRLWAEQLGIDAAHEFDADGPCRLIATRRQAPPREDSAGAPEGGAPASPASSEGCRSQPDRALGRLPRDSRRLEPDR